MRGSFLKPLLIAFSTLTPFHIPVGPWTSSQLRDSVVFYPLVGAALGGLMALAGKCALSHDLQALLVLLVWVLLTMAFHLDGLGDCLDGWFGGRNPKDRRRIMKDAALGVYGATGIILLLLSKYVLLTHLFSQDGAWKWLIAIPTAARFSVPICCLIATPPPGDQGLGSKVLGLSFPAFLVSVFFTLGLWPLVHWKLTLVWAVCAVISVSLAALSNNRIGGLTGDGLGTGIELTEVSLLFLACFPLT